MVIRIVKYFIVSFFIFNACLFSQDISVKAFVDSTDYLVGDFIHYKIRVTSNENINVYRPVIKDSLGTTELIRREPVNQEDKDGKKIREYKYIISSYDSGDVVIPPISVLYNFKNDSLTRTINTNPVFLTVHTVKVNAQEDIKDVKSPIRIPLDWKMILLYVLIGVLILVAAILAYLYYRKNQAAKKGIVKVIRRKPHEEAINSLRELESKKLWQKGYIKQYHTEITEIIRRYFEERFGIPALEITTNELLEKLSRSKETSLIQELTSGFLYNADMVKFAKFVPMDDVNEEMTKQAYQIVEKTVPVIEEFSEAENV